MRAVSRGFTLVELGIVLAIISIMMAYGATRMQGFRENAGFERIATDMDGIAKMGIMHMERGGADIPAWRPMEPPGSRPPALTPLLPPGFIGNNPLSLQPYEIRVVNPFVEVRTALPPNSQWVQTWNPAICIDGVCTIVGVGGCAGGCTASLRKRWLPPSSMVPLLMEKRFLYRDCCCDGSCLPCPFPQPAWYCP